LLFRPYIDTNTIHVVTKLCSTISVYSRKNIDVPKFILKISISDNHFLHADNINGFATILNIPT